MYSAATEQFRRELTRQRLRALGQDRWGAPDAIVLMPGSEGRGLAMDAQAPLTTTPNNAVPGWMTYAVYPEILKILYSPLEFATIAGDERKIGDWVTSTEFFPITEYAGEVSSYDDYSNNGMANMNATFPQRQSYHYQGIMEVGEREEAMLAKGRINAVAEKREALTWNLAQFQNGSYAYGISGLQNYGVLNDPALPAAIQPGPKAYNSQAHGPWITNGVVTATQNEIFTDVQSLYSQLVSQAAGNVQLKFDQKTPMVLAMSPNSQVALTQPNAPYNSTSAMELIKGTFPNMEFETAVQYATAAGNYVQLIARKVQNQQSLFVAFTEKMRAHMIVRELSAWKQKYSQGTWGCVTRQPFAFATMLGV